MYIQSGRAVWGGGGCFNSGVRCAGSCMHGIAREE